MSKSVFVCCLVFVLVVTLCQAYKGDKKHRKRGKGVEEYQQYKYSDSKDQDGFSSENMLEDIKKYDVTGYSKHVFGNGKHIILQKKGDKKKDRKLKLKLKKKHRKNKLGWMKFKSEEECEPQCERGQFCITGPLGTKPFCVKKRNLKKSIKLFRHYEKQEKKEWRKFRKEHYNQFDDEEKEKHGKDKHLNIQKYNHPKKGGKRHLKKPLVPPFMEKSEEDKCSENDLNEMRIRLMGWFHLLHGQDHLQKKKDGEFVKGLHKHESVKKELREDDGKKCPCYKSVMWQFREMDVDQNKRLSLKELATIEENSMEPCVRPFLATCDKDGNDEVSPDEWCCCFGSAAAPCQRRLNEMRTGGDFMTYRPRCDKEGYYMREQCQGNWHNSREDQAGCWCVDYNGFEYKGTFRRGRAHCSKIAMRGFKEIPMV